MYNVLVKQLSNSLNGHTFFVYFTKRVNDLHNSNAEQKRSDR